jgi:hypothetical protein
MSTETLSLLSPLVRDLLADNEYTREPLSVSFTWYEGYIDALEAAGEGFAEPRSTEAADEELFLDLMDLERDLLDALSHKAAAFVRYISTLTISTFEESAPQGSFGESDDATVTFTDPATGNSEVLTVFFGYGDAPDSHDALLELSPTLFNMDGLAEFKREYWGL